MIQPTGLAVDDDLGILAMTSASGTLYTMSLDGTQLAPLLTQRTSPLRGVGFFKHRLSDAKKLLYFCSGTKLFKVDQSLTNPEVVAVADLTLSGSFSRGECSGLQVEDFFSIPTLTVLSTNGTVAYLTQFGITRLVSSSSSTAGETPIFDIATIPLPGAESNPYIEVYPAGSLFRIFLGPTLRVVSGVSAAAGASFTSVVVIEDTAANTPTPRPAPIPGGIATLSGAVLESGRSEASAPLTILSGRGVPNVPVYLSRISSGAQTTADSDVARVALTDKNGRYTFTGLPQGNYRLSFDRADLAFFTPSITVSTSEDVPDVAALVVDDQPALCSSKSRVDQIFAFTKAARSLLTIGTTQATKYRRLGKKLSRKEQKRLNTAIDKLVSTVESKHSTLLALSQLLPEVLVTCEEGSPCTLTNFKGTVTSSSASFSQLVRSVRAVITRGKTFLKSQRGINEFSVLAKITKTTATARKNVKALPQSSFVCPVETKPSERESS